MFWSFQLSSVTVCLPEARLASYMNVIWTRQGDRQPEIALTPAPSPMSMGEGGRDGSRLAEPIEVPIEGRHKLDAVRAVSRHRGRFHRDPVCRSESVASFQLITCR